MGHDTASRKAIRRSIMISFAALILVLLLAILLAPQRDASRPFCGTPTEELWKLGLPEVTAVNWGQGHGPYSLPPERLLLCASGSSFLWRQGHGVTQLTKESTKELMPSLLKLWPLEDRGGHDGSFIWILDEDYSLIIAPMMQRRDEELVEVKHGDLVPGETFFGPNGLRGAYRGLARMGGEFNLVGNGNGSEWIMHAKSGYTAYRVPVAAAKDYYHVQIQDGRNETDIASNFQRCVYREIYRVRDALSRLFCFMRSHGIKVSLGEFRQCDIRSSLGGIPDLTECTVKDPGNASACSFRSTQEKTKLHIVDWYAPGQDRCKLEIADYDSLLRKLDTDLARLFRRGSRNASQIALVQKQIRALRKHSCLFSKEFTEQLHCNVHGCFGEGFTRNLKVVEQTLATDLAEAERLWALASNAWSVCKAPKPESTYSKKKT